MDQANAPRPSGIPRLSRLPVRTVRPSPSKDYLQTQQQQTFASSVGGGGRLRHAPSREQLSFSNSTTTRPIPPPSTRTPAPQTLRNRNPSTNSQPAPALRKSSSNAVLRKPSRQILRQPEPVYSEEAVDSGSYEDGEKEYPVLSRKHRPSLAERTMETLQAIPSSPAVGKRRESNFFNPESPMHPPSQSSRPGSSYQSDSSMGAPVRSFSSRPSSSSGPDNVVVQDFRASTNTFVPPKTTLQNSTPMKRPSAIRSLRTPSGVGSNTSPTHPVSETNHLPTINSGSKTFTSRQLKPRASVNNLFRKPSMPSMNQVAGIDELGYGDKNASVSSSETTSLASKVSHATTITSISSNALETAPPKSSSALRDQIAKAKAAKRATTSKQPSSALMRNGNDAPVMASGTFDFGLADDPFNQNINQGGSKGLLKKRIDAARTDGRLNIAAMDLKEVPEEVMEMYNFESAGGSWAECVDLTRFVAADNEFELLGDDVFPDVDPRDAMDDEDAKGNQFGGLETLDLHGNVLIALPRGLRRLELLTTLNLAKNKLGNECMEIIAQIPSLRDLNLAGNGMVGALDDSITRLTHLETLDISNNSITHFPDGLVALVRLRVLNITGNQFKFLPFGVLHQLPLIQLLAAKNNLSGTLIEEDVTELRQLQVLDVTANSLVKLSGVEQLLLPALHQLSCSSNRLTSLPDMSSWVSLLTLAAEDNHIASIPSGFTSLTKLKNVNFSGNDLKVLDDRIGLMTDLDIFRISGNPLREKKLSGMTTEDLKRALKLRIEPEIVVERSSDDGFYSANASPISPRTPSTEWPIRLGGILDRSSTKSYSLNPVAAADVAANNDIKVLELHHNMFKDIPNSIAFFAGTLTSLSLAHNELTGSNYMIDDLELPVLRELNLSSNTFNSLQPLVSRLVAPNLEKLDISFNRLTFLPPLKAHFPRLSTVLASNNTIRELSPESVKGLKILDCSSNEISSLNARIGLLGGPGGLERLDVKGNRFRVPKYTVLDKGTEATLAWLRDRIPADELDVD